MFAVFWFKRYANGIGGGATGNTVGAAAKMAISHTRFAWKAKVFAEDFQLAGRAKCLAANRCRKDLCFTWGRHGTLRPTLFVLLMGYGLPVCSDER